MSAMCGLRPETCAKLAASLASCLAVACENMANQDRCGGDSLSIFGLALLLWRPPVDVLAGMFFFNPPDVLFCLVCAAHHLRV